MEMTINDYVDISKTHYTECICDICIQVRKWNRDIFQNEIIASRLSSYSNDTEECKECEDGRN